jgi:peptidoglycan/xylan/chitin deacetylase (PgdA/CDA1 family)
MAVQPEAMILVLTYHKVLRGPDPESGFYTIQAEHLERQLELLAQSGFHALSPEDLVDFAPQPGPAYLLSFDDGTQDHYEVVLPLLARRRCRAVFFAPTARLNRAGYLTSQQISELSRAGQTIGLHSHEHHRLDWLGEEDIRVQMQLSRQIVRDLTGASPVFFAPVGGYFDQRVRAIALESDIRVIRTMRWGYNQDPDFTALECVPVNRHFTDEEFRRVLEFRRRSALYAAKEVTKKIIPSRTYENLRTSLFGRLRRK